MITSTNKINTKVFKTCFWSFIIVPISLAKDQNEKKDHNETDQSAEGKDGMFKLRNSYFA